MTINGCMGLTMAMQNIQQGTKAVNNNQDGIQPQKSKTPKGLLTTKEAARYLGVHVQTIYTYVKQGLLKASRLPTTKGEPGAKRLRFHIKDLDALLVPANERQATAEDRQVARQVAAAMARS